MVLMHLESLLSLARAVLFVWCCIKERENTYKRTASSGRTNVGWQPHLSLFVILELSQIEDLKTCTIAFAQIRLGRLTVCQAGVLVEQLPG